MNAPNQLSFLPDDYLVRKAQHRTNVMCASLFVVMIAAIAITFTTAERRMRSAEDRHAKVNKDYTEAAKRIAEVDQLQNRQKLLARQAELAASLIDRVPRSKILAEVTNRLPGGVSLTDLEMTRKKRAAPVVTKTAFAKKSAAKSKSLTLPPAPDQFDVQLQLVGVAGTDQQVSAFMDSLQKSGLFSAVELLYSAQLDRSETDSRKFNLELTLNPAADIRPVANAKKGTTLTQVTQ